MSRDRRSPPPVPEPIPGGGVVDAHTHLDACLAGASAGASAATGGSAGASAATGGSAGASAAEAGTLAAVLDRASAAGVGAMVTTADDLASARWAAWAAGTDARVFAAVGLHPTRSRDLDDAARAEIERLTAVPRVVAVGESGMDDYWTTRREDCAPLDVQREAFAWHIDLAKRAGLPLVIHDREAHAPILDVLAAEGAPPTVVFHCFSGDTDLARRCAEAGWFTSFSGTATFRNAPDLRRAVAWMPAELVLVETDAPFLTPHPYRGRPNEPYCVPHTVRDLAELRDEAPERLAATAAANAERAFELAEQPQPSPSVARGSAS